MIRTVFDNGTLVWTGDETASLVAAAPDFFKFDNRINAFRSRACDYASILQKVRSLQLPFTDEACAFEPIRNLALQETLIPRPHQQTAFDAWRKNGYRGVAALPTGSGKTILAVMAMIFRNLHLIFKKSENDSPFQKDNIRMMKEIGIFSIAVPVIGFIMSIIVRLVIGVDAAEISINQGGIFMGIIVLCLTQYFIHGANLEKDVDGLL